MNVDEDIGPWPTSLQILVWSETDTEPQPQLIVWPNEVAPHVKGRFINVCKWPRPTAHGSTHMPATVQCVVDLMTAINENDPWKFLIIRGMKGGWEGWLQVELAFLLATHGIRWSREMPIYKKKAEQGREKLVDLWGIPAGMSEEEIVGKDALGIELKVEYRNASVGTRFVEDIVKVLAGLKDDCIGPMSTIPAMYGDPGNATFPRVRGTIMLCLAITTRVEDLGRLDDYIEKKGWGHYFPEGERVYYIKLFGREISGGTRTQDTWLMWWEKKYLRHDFAM